MHLVYHAYVRDEDYQRHLRLDVLDLLTLMSVITVDDYIRAHIGLREDLLCLIQMIAFRPFSKSVIVMSSARSCPRWSVRASFRELSRAGAASRIAGP